jgi:hypothetical protein
MTDVKLSATASAPSATSAATGAASASSPTTSTTATSTYKPIEKLNFDNSSLRNLPVDPDRRNVTRQVPGACFSRVDPTPLKNPQLIAYSADVLRDCLELDADNEAKRKEFAEYFG